MENCNGSSNKRLYDSRKLSVVLQFECKKTKVLLCVGNINTNPINTIYPYVYFLFSDQSVHSLHSPSDAKLSCLFDFQFSGQLKLPISIVLSYKYSLPYLRTF